MCLTGRNGLNGVLDEKIKSMLPSFASVKVIDADEISADREFTGIFTVDDNRPSDRLNKVKWFAKIIKQLEFDFFCNYVVK